MRVTLTSDLHGYFPRLPGGDLLIIGGDLTFNHTIEEWNKFSTWLNKQDYEKIVFIAGNHDTMIEEWDREQDNEGYNGPISDPDERIEYLCNSGTEFGGLKIWGSPWTMKFKGMNPDCMAFTCNSEKEMAEKFSLIPENVDILITHSPPYGILDKVKKYNSRDSWNPKTDGYQHVGSKSLADRIGSLKTPPALWVCGHIHEAYGKRVIVIGNDFQNRQCLIINASFVNEDYDPVNSPVTIEI